MNRQPDDRRVINLTCNPTDYDEEIVFFGNNKEQDIYVLVLNKKGVESLFCGRGQIVTQLIPKDRIGFDGTTELYMIDRKQLHINRSLPANATINRCPFRQMLIRIK